MTKREVLTVVVWVIGSLIFCIGIPATVIPLQKAIDDMWLYGTLLGFGSGLKWNAAVKKQKAQQEAKNQTTEKN